jgi:hypothetical protein
MEGGISTFFMFSARRSYSSRTSCSSGERSSLGAEADADVDSVDSIIKRVWAQLFSRGLCRFGATGGNVC